jgi:hypothetical protein
MQIEKIDVPSWEAWQPQWEVVKTASVRGGSFQVCYTAGVSSSCGLSMWSVGGDKRADLDLNTKQVQALITLLQQYLKDEADAI